MCAFSTACVRSHHRNCARLLAKHGDKLPPWRVPRNLSFWATHAPGVLDNYVLRHLLGKHGMCRCVDLGHKNASGAGLCRPQSMLCTPCAVCCFFCFLCDMQL